MSATPQAPFTMARRQGHHLADNVAHFVRVLRAAGMPLGTDRTVTALQALQMAGVGSRQQFKAVLAACLIDRAEHRLLFDQAFELFWRDPDLLGRMRAMLLPQVRLQSGAVPAPPENRRLAEALFPQPAGPQPRAPEQDEHEIHAELTWNDRELLRRADFETLTADEWRAAQRLVARLPQALPPEPVRRWQPSARAGVLDARATLAAMSRQGGEVPTLRWRRHRRQPPPLVLLADISGSMGRYTRMLLHLAHALSRAKQRVECFVFGTRLTRITQALTQRDPDLAVSRVVDTVADWSGGTRINACLHAFNRHWARRVMPGHATVLLVTDGLERDDPTALGREVAQLRRGCRQLLWLNPLLRYESFEPLAAGMRAIEPHVTRLMPAHNLASLEALVQALATGRH